jgi:serine/threonine protein kinase
LFIVQCLHQGLAGTAPAVETGSSDSNTTPIFIDSPSTTIGSRLIQPATPLCGLVLECGGPNLFQFLQMKSSALDVIHRVHILRDIVSAVEFLHAHEIVHGDLKPDNIVCFASLREGLMRWKLIDLESCYDMQSNPSISLSDSFDITPEYFAPELLSMCHSSASASSASASSSSSLQVNYTLDIWSLGMVAVYTLKGKTVWKILSPQNSFNLLMVREWNENQLSSLLTNFGEKEKSFIFDCLKTRSSCQYLLRKSLFSTNNSTVLSNTLRTMSENMTKKFENLTVILSEVLSESNEIVIEGMEERLSELFTLLTMTNAAAQGRE